MLHKATRGKLLTARELAEVTGVCVETVRQRLAAGGMRPKEKVGGTYLYDYTAVMVVASPRRQIKMPRRLL